MAILTGIYVLLTGVYVLIAYFTLRAIHRQADIAEAQSRDALATASTAEKAAIAARDSADALMSAERPWILASKANLTTRSIVHSDEPDKGSQKHWGISFSIKNSGKTPAIIHEFVGGLDFVTDLSHTDTVYGEPYASQPDQIMAPQEESSEITFIMERPLTPQESESWRKGELVSYVGFGRVSYSDSLEKRHISSFCFIFDRQQTRFRFLCHNPSHNKYT